MKILILGGRGRLASALAREWSGSHEVVSLARPDVDVADLERLERVLDDSDFDVLVNGTGMTSVDLCESEREVAAAVNTEAPRVMAAAARKKSARFLHFSTDYVFAGLKQEAYTEDDLARPLGCYGQTKLAGESAILADDPSHLVVRVSWVFGPDKPSFIDMILNQARTNADVAAVADKFSLPTHASDVARWMEPFFGTGLPGGLLHACNSGPACSWRDLGAHALVCAAEAGIPLATATVAPIALSDMKQFVAQRPVFTALSTKKLTRLTGIEPRSWHDAVRDYVQSHHASIPSTA